jgi:hypothetical protein
MRLRDERLRRTTASLDTDLGTAPGDIRADHRIRHRHRIVLIEQPVKDPLDGVPLLARRIQIRPQHLVDQQLVGIKPGLAWRQLLTRFRPHRRQRLGHRPSGHPVLVLQRPA